MIRTLLPTVLMFLLGAAIAVVALTAYVRVAHAAPELAGAWSPVPPPDGRSGASALPAVDARTSASSLPFTPAAEPDPWRTGAPLGAILVGVAVIGLAGARRDPRRAWLWAAIAGAALLAIDALRTGAPPSLEMLLAPGAVLAAGVMPGAMRTRPHTIADPLAVPEYIPEPDDTQRGSAAGPLLVILACAGLTAAAMGAWSCAGVKTAGGVVTDCAVAVAPAELERARPVIEAAIANARRPDGTIDTAPLLDVARTMSLAVGGCALAEAFARLRAPTFSPRTDSDGGDWVWAEVKARQYPGRSFRLASGALF